MPEFAYLANYIHKDGTPTTATGEVDAPTADQATCKIADELFGGGHEPWQIQAWPQSNS